ncbi:MAG: DUF4238 domain-containing protein [Pseudomonadota bacterium]
MADRKNQHFVPRTLLKPWTQGSEGKAINLYNIRAACGIPKAPVKNQCSRDYFYGKDLQIETWLGHGEDAFRRVVATLPSTDPSHTAAALEMLRDFSYLQAIRTERSLAEEAEMLREMYDQVYLEMLPPEDDPLPTHEQIVREAMERWQETSLILHDLKGVLVVNESRVPFIISDNPAIHTNRLHVQRFKNGNFGIQQAGMILTMPISPRVAVLYYDGDVYTIPAQRGMNLVVTKDADAQAFNEFQYLSAGENLYFADWGELARIEAGFPELSDRRLRVHFRFNLLVPKAGEEEIYVKAPAHVVAPEGKSIIHLEAMSYQPRLWPSELRFRPDGTGYSNGSGAGYLRKRWATELGLTNRDKQRLAGVTSQWRRG